MPARVSDSLTMRGTASPLSAFLPTGYTYAEIAGQLEIGLSAAKMRIARARSRLRCRLYEERPAMAKGHPER